jgi:uncharacterized repeat protein (TIGR04076 family)
MAGKRACLAASEDTVKRCGVMAKVVDPGQCRYYSTGATFSLTGFTPKGVCDSAYAALSRDAQTLRYGGRLPWQRNGVVLTRCPDPQGATWELSLIDETPEDL